MFKLSGVIKMIGDTVQVTDKFAKRDFVINESLSMYPQDIIFQASQDKCNMLDSFVEGNSVTVSFNLRGREWTSPQGEVKYFNTLDAWRIENADGAPNSAPTQAPVKKSQPAPSVEAEAEDEGEGDDLPF